MIQRNSNKTLIIVVLLALIAGGLFLVFKNQKEVTAVVQNAIEKTKTLATTSATLSDTVKKTFLSPGGLVAKTESSKAQLTKSGVYTLTNAERKKEGLKALGQDVRLETIASRRAKDMFAKQYFEHISPSGDSASIEADTIGYEYIVIGENIALGNFENDIELVNAWMASPGHRANILNAKFTNLGVAVEKGTYNGKSTWIAVQIFARPLSLCQKVNETLKVNAQIKIDTLATLHKEADLLQAELRASSPKTQAEVDAYNKRVNDYNILADKINTLNIEVKADIDTYNADIRRYNTCIK